MATKENEFLDFKEATAFLGISKSTLYKLTSSKEIKFYKPRGKLFFKKEHLIEFVTNPKQSVNNINTENVKEVEHGN